MRRKVALALVAGAAAALVPLTALAHPLGNFTINHYSGIEVAGDQVRVHYVADLAEIPAFEERDRVAADANYAQDEARSLASDLHLSVGGHAMALRVAAASVAWRPGQAGLQTLRIEALLTAPLPDGTVSTVDLRDATFAGRLGWREVTARATGGARLLGSDVPAISVTNELRTYPQDMLTSPLDVTAAHLRVRAGGVAPAPAVLLPGGPVTGVVADRFAALIATRDLSVPVLLLALLMAVVLGAVHALSPGHGKAVMAGYLVGSRRTRRHAVWLAVTITVTHTAGVFALGGITLYAAQRVAPDRLYPWLTLLSGVLVAALGVLLVAVRLRAALRRSGATGAANRVASADGLHATAAGSSPHPGVAVPAEHRQSHGPAHMRHAGHGHGEAHTHHSDSGDAHGHGEAHTHHAAHGHAHAESHPHRHGPFGRVHTHGEAPATGGGAQLGRLGLIALGISGGLVPCPSALVVLLAGIALHRIAAGMLLVVAFSAGLALTLVGIGVALAGGAALLRHLPPIALRAARSRSVRLLPVGSALVIAVAGVGLTTQAIPGIR